MITLYPCQKLSEEFLFWTENTDLFMVPFVKILLPSKPALQHCCWATPATGEPVNEAARGQQRFSRRISTDAVASGKCLNVFSRASRLTAFIYNRGDSETGHLSAQKSNFHNTTAK